MNKATKNIGINVYGYLNELSGLSESARSNIKALLENDIDVNIKSFTYNHTPNEYLKEKSTNINFPINLIHININFIEKFIQDVGIDFLKNKYNIAYWAWEFSEPPIEIIEYANLFDEIWTPSDFCVNSFNKLTLKPVIKIPHPIEIPQKKAITKNTKKFTFLSVFDSVSSLERKNPMATIRTFLNVFKNNPEVELILKTHNLDQFKEEKQRFSKIITENKNIKLINEKLSKEKLNELFYNCDAYISLHRSEGFGLTLAEAMSYGKPVIATGYSGNLEFMNINNSFLVPYELTETLNDYGLTKKGYIFADVKILDASNILLDIVNKNFKDDISKKALETIQKNYSYQKIGSLMLNRLEMIIKNKSSNRNLNLESKIVNLIAENKSLHQKAKKYERNIFIKIKKYIKNL